MSFTPLRSHSSPTCVLPATSSRLSAWIVLLMVLIPGMRAHAEPAAFTVAPDSIRQLLSRQQFPEAEAISRRELRRLAPGAPSYAEMLDVLVEACWRQLTGQPADADSLGQAALRLRVKLHGEQSPRLADALAALGRIQRNSGDLPQASSTLERAAALRELAGSSDSLKLAEDLTALASVVKRLRQEERAVDLQKRVLAIRTKLRPPHHRDIARSHTNLALAYDAAGRGGDARREFELALRCFDTTEPPDSQGLGQCLITFTGQLLSQKEADSALSVANRTLELYSRYLPKSHGNWVYGYFQLAAAEQLKGSLQEAMDHYRRSIAIYEEQRRRDDAAIARVLLSFGDLWIKLGAPDSALAYYQEAGRLFGGQLGSKPEEAEAWWRQGAAFLDQGALERADSLMGMALEQRRLSARPEADEIYFNQHDLAIARLLLGRLEDTFELEIEAAKGATKATSMSIAALTEGEAYRQTQHFALTIPIALSALKALGDDAGRTARAWDVIIRSRALVMDELASRHRAPAGDSAYAGLLAARGAVARDLSRLTRFSMPKDSTLLHAAAQRRRELETELATKNGAFQRYRHQAGVGFQEVLGALGPREALVGFVRYAHREPKVVAHAVFRASRTGRGGIMASNRAFTFRYGAFIVEGSGRVPRFLLLGHADRIDSLARAWRADIRSGRRGDRRAGEALRREIWDPVRLAVGTSNTVLLVPDGELHMVNFAALPTGRGNYLVETGPTFHMMTTERDTPGLSNSSTSGRGILAVGGVNFDQAGGGQAAVAVATRPASRGVEDCSDDSRRRLVPLPGSLTEAAQAAKRWSSSHPGEAVRILEGSAATESAVLSEAVGSRALHFATHGFYTRPCADSKAKDREAEDLWSEYPLLRSGIALAGSNRRENRGMDDGILTAEEIATSDLSSVEWMVLSACESGLGEASTGEGVYGLRRALAIAGVKTAVMSLWPVDDLATQQWMRRLYEARFERGMTVAEAVRSASRGMLEDRRARGLAISPKTWGAFIATGAWH